MAQPVREATLAGVLGTLVGVAGAWRPSLWTDEVATLSGATRSWSQLRELLESIDAVHGLYYVLMHLWVAVAGTSPLALRLPSALAVGLVAAGVSLLGRRLVGTAAARWAALVVIVVPGTTWLATEARSGALVMAATVWCALALLAALDRGGLRWVGYGALLALAVLLFVQTAVLVLAHALTLVWSRAGRARLGPWALSAGGGLVLAAPVALVALGQRGQVAWIEETGAGSLRSVLSHQWFQGALVAGALMLVLAAAVVLRPSWAPTPTPATGTATGTTADAAATGTTADAAATGTATATATATAVGRPVTLVHLALPWLLVPTVAVLAVSVLVSPMYVPRYLTYTVPALALLAGAALAALRPAWLRVGVAVLLVAAVLPTYRDQRTEHAKDGADLSAVARVVAAQARPGDVLVVVPDGGEGRSPRRALDAYPRDLGGLDDVGLRVVGAQTGRLWDVGAPVDELALAQVERVWVLADPARFGVEVEAALSALAAQGFTVTQQWRGPTTVVYLGTSSP